MPGDPFYLEVLERRIKACEADIKSERAWNHYQKLKGEIEEWYGREVKVRRRKMRSTDPLDEYKFGLEMGRLRKEYLERLFFALKEVARIYALETAETPEVR
jgi:hypothetical protein